MFRVRFVYISCIFRVCFVYISCMFRARFVLVWCLPGVCLMYVSSPRLQNCFFGNYTVPKTTTLFLLKLYSVQNYKSVSSEIMSCPHLQNGVLSNDIVLKTTKVFPLKLYRVQITSCFPLHLYRVQTYKNGSSPIISCPQLQKCFL